MVDQVLTFQDTSAEIKDMETTSTSLWEFGLGYDWPLLYYGDALSRFQNLRGLILKLQERQLNLDFDEDHRTYFIGIDNLFRDSFDEIKSKIREADYWQEQLWNSSSLPTWEKHFEQLRQLPKNWDSYGAPRISKEAIEKGKSILTVMTSIGFPERFFVAPAPDGGIQIEWNLPRKELILEIPRTGKPVRYLLIETTVAGEEVEIEGNVPEREGLEQLLKRISV
jgi:hypothetical protein